MMKYVYMIQALESGHYKIGVSKHPQKRIKQLITGNSSELKLIETYQSEHAYKIERTLQRRYTGMKKEGEWFDLSIQHETTFLTECEQIQANINILKENGNVFI